MDEDLEAIRARGYVILPELIPRAELDEMRRALGPELERGVRGRNNFEGYRTGRVYSLVARHPLFAHLVEHPRILAICDRLLEPNYLLTASQAIELHPGETPQPFHTDDAFYPLPRPRAAVSVSTIYAVDAFTVENGATQVVSGSHTFSDEQVGDVLGQIDFRTAGKEARQPTPAPPPSDAFAAQLVDVIMPAGSVVVFLGTLLHRGGENRARAPRLALSNQYCAPWARPQENYSLSIPRAQVRRMSPRVQALLGYSIHPPFMGHVLGTHPLRVLDED